MHGFAEQRQHDQHDQVAGELQRQGGRDRGVDDQLVTECDLADQPGVACDADRSALQRLLRGEPRPQRDRDEQQEALAVHRPGAKYGREDEVIDREQRQRVHECPREPADAAEVARKQLAMEEVGEQRAMPRKACLRLSCVRAAALGQNGTQARRHGEQNTSVRRSPQATRHHAECERYCGATAPFLSLSPRMGPADPRLGAPNDSGSKGWTSASTAGSLTLRAGSSRIAAVLASRCVST